LTEDKKLEGGGMEESKLKIENRGWAWLLWVSSNDIEAMGRGRGSCEGRVKGVDYQTPRLTWALFFFFFFFFFFYLFVSSTSSSSSSGCVHGEISPT